MSIQPARQESKPKSSPLFRWLSLSLTVLVLAWAGYSICRFLFSGRLWFWNLLDSAPPVVLVVIPLALAVMCLVLSKQRWLWFSVCLLLFAVGFPSADINVGAKVLGNCSQINRPTQSVSLLSWNTQYWGEDAPQGANIQNALAAVDADLIALQEVHGSPNKVITDMERPKLDKFQNYHIATKGEWITLSRYPIKAHNGHAEREMYLRTDIALPGGQIVSLFNVHMPLHVSLSRSMQLLGADFFEFVRTKHSSRSLEFELLSKAIASNPYPVLIAGDFNSTNIMSQLKDFSAGLCDSVAGSKEIIAGTWTLAGQRLWRPDYVFLSPNLPVIDHSVAAMQNISDHLGVRVEFDAGALPKAGS